jgi:acetyl-CoA synthetase
MELIRAMLSDKQRPRDSPAPQLTDYEIDTENFSWDTIAELLTGSPEPETLNIADIILDRAVRRGRGTDVAIRWLAGNGEQSVDYSYSRLLDLSRQFAGALDFLQLPENAVICTALGRVPALYIAAFGVLRRGGVLCPLFAALGPEPLQTRMVLARAQVLLTTDHIYKNKIAGIRHKLPNLQWIILTDRDDVKGLPDDCVSYAHMMEKARPHDQVAATRPDDPALMHFTSGTTGTPKGALHVHRALLLHHVTSATVLDLSSHDIYWCTADPGWVTGTSYGVFGPLSVGATMIVDEAEFDALRWYQTLQDQAVEVWYTAPTAIRMLIRAGDELPGTFNLSRLRHIVSVGEPLNQDAVHWSNRVLKRPIHDTWWQTETGGIILANFPSMPIKAGSMGKPVPGLSLAIVRREGDKVEVIHKAGEIGEIAIKSPWPSMFTAYVGQEDRYKHCFAGGYYLSGDLATRDEDGYFWFVGRADDVIKSAGHLIGPFEVESTLLEHPAVAEAAVIGKPDPLLLAVVKAYVVLKPSYPIVSGQGEEIKNAIMAFARSKLGAAVAPREITFVANLPKTRSGKIMRRLLLAREQGLPEGDISALEPAVSNYHFTASGGEYGGATSGPK